MELELKISEEALRQLVLRGKDGSTALMGVLAEMNKMPGLRYVVGTSTEHFDFSQQLYDNGGRLEFSMKAKIGPGMEGIYVDGVRRLE